MGINLNSEINNISAKYRAAKDYYLDMYQKFNRQFAQSVEKGIDATVDNYFNNIITKWNSITANDLDLEKETGKEARVKGVKDGATQDIESFFSDYKGERLSRIYEAYIQKELIQGMSNVANSQISDILKGWLEGGTGGMRGKSGRTDKSNIRADAIYVNKVDIDSTFDYSNSIINGLNLEVGLNFDELLIKMKNDENYLFSLMEEMKKIRPELIPFGFSIKHYTSANSIDGITYTSNKPLMDHINNLFEINGGKGNGYWTLNWAYPYMVSQISNFLYPLIGPTIVALVSNKVYHPIHELLDGNNFLAYHLHIGDREVYNDGKNDIKNWYHMKIRNSNLYWNIAGKSYTIQGVEKDIALKETYSLKYT